MKRQAVFTVKQCPPVAHRGALLRQGSITTEKGGAMNAFDFILWALQALYWVIRIVMLVLTGV